jgi:hypothetical protein
VQQKACHRIEEAGGGLELGDLGGLLGRPAWSHGDQGVHVRLAVPGATQGSDAEATPEHELHIVAAQGTGGLGSDRAGGGRALYRDHGGRVVAHSATGIGSVHGFRGLGPCAGTLIATTTPMG